MKTIPIYQQLQTKITVWCYKEVRNYFLLICTNFLTKRHIEAGYCQKNHYGSLMLRWAPKIVLCQILFASHMHLFVVKAELKNIYATHTRCGVTISYSTKRLIFHNANLTELYRFHYYILNQVHAVK